MNNDSRRTFLKTLGATGVAAATAARPIKAETYDKKILNPGRMGVLVDTTICIGCRNCEWACKEAHDIEPGDIESYHNKEAFKEYRRPAPDNFTVVNEFDDPNSDYKGINVKDNCKHCDYPSCASACIVGAFDKLDNGAVVWDGSKCIGCRYCMVACPFQIPTFEYEKAIQPRIRKCDFCYERQAEGKIPACVDICPVESMIFAPMNEIISLAKKKIERHPERYNKHIYGLEEVGGTSWLYLTSVEHEKLNMVKLDTKPNPGTVESIQHGIFAYFVPPLALYAWLGGIMWKSKRDAKKKAEEEAQKTNSEEEKNA